MEEAQRDGGFAGRPQRLEVDVPLSPEDETVVVALRSRLPDVEDGKGEKRKFETYPIGYFQHRDMRF